MKYPILLFVTLILSLTQNGVTSIYSEDIDTTFGTKITLDGSTSFLGILKSHFIGSYKTNSTKKLTLAASNGHGLLAAFRTIDLRPNKVDNLTLSAPFQAPLVLSNTNLSFHNSLYDSDEQKITYDSPSGTIEVTFQTGLGSSRGYDGFQFTYTAYKSAPCLSEHFNCRNGKCIPKFLTCDGHNHCGNRVDQINCTSFTTIPSLITKPSFFTNVPFITTFPFITKPTLITKPSSYYNIPGIVSGVVLLVAAAAIIIFIIIRRASRSTAHVQTVIGHPPPLHYPQQTGTCSPPPPLMYSPGQVNPGQVNPGQISSGQIDPGHVNPGFR